MTNGFMGVGCIFGYDLALFSFYSLQSKTNRMKLPSPVKGLPICSSL